MNKLIFIISFFLIFNIILPLDNNINKLFNDYLEKINYKLDNSSKKFIILLAEDCPNCIKNIIDMIDKYSNVATTNLIVVYKYKLRNKKIIELSKKFNSIMDSTSIFTRYNISPYNSCLIITGNKKIKEIITFDKIDSQKKEYLKIILKK